MKATPPSSYVGFGPGKVILLGEHAVVYGRTAIAAPISLGVTATAVPARRCSLALPPGLDPSGRRLLVRAFDRAAALCGSPRVSVTLQADLPPAVGLGSSAAVSVACGRVLLQAAGRAPDPKQVLRVALEMEREFHGTPSGLDHTTSAEGRLIRFHWRGGRATATPLFSRGPLKLLVALVGERGPTAKMVADLQERNRRWPKRYRRLFDEIGRLAEEGAKAIELADPTTLGDLMNINQGLLAALGVSSAALEQMVHRLRQLGALGAKLTGAGGGGAVIGLFLEPEPVVARLAREGIPCFGSQIAGPPAL